MSAILSMGEKVVRNWQNAAHFQWVRRREQSCEENSGNWMWTEFASDAPARRGIGAWIVRRNPGLADYFCGRHRYDTIQYTVLGVLGGELCLVYVLDRSWCNTILFVINPTNIPFPQIFPAPRALSPCIYAQLPPGALFSLHRLALPPASPQSPDSPPMVQACQQHLTWPISFYPGTGSLHPIGRTVLLKDPCALPSQWAWLGSGGVP